MKRKISLTLFIIGIILCLTAAAFMFFGILPLSLRIAILIIGIGLIASSNFNLLK